MEHVQRTLTCEKFGIFPRGLEIVAMFDQLDPQSAHRGIFFNAVAMGHHNLGRQAVAPPEYRWIVRGCRVWR